MSPTEGAFSRGSSGSANAGTPNPASAASTLSSPVESARLATTANSEPRLALSSAVAISAVARTASGVLPSALRTSMTGVPKLAATRALKENSVGAPTSV